MFESNEGEKIVACGPCVKAVKEGIELSEREFTTVIVGIPPGPDFREIELRGRFRIDDFPRELRWKGKR